MALACSSLMHVKDKSTCEENFSGVGTRLYIFLPEDLENSPEYEDTKAEFTESSFSFAEGKGAWEVHLKPKSGKVTSTSNPNAGGFSNVFTCVVAKNMHDMSFLARILNGRNFGAMIKADDNSYYVLYSSTFDVEFSMESDTGDTPDSDHGHTITITCSPMKYPLTKWRGTLTILGDVETA